MKNDTKIILMRMLPAICIMAMAVILLMILFIIELKNYNYIKKLETELTICQKVPVPLITFK